jgi:hypothetical protein
MMCFVNVSSPWFAHANLWFWQFTLIAIFLDLCRLISFWTQTCKLILISFWSWHTIFFGES